MQLTGTKGVRDLTRMGGKGKEQRIMQNIESSRYYQNVICTNQNQSKRMRRMILSGTFRYRNRILDKARKRITSKEKPNLF